MKERPILFSAPMVRAILAGTKTQTRRVVNGQEQWPTNTHHITFLSTRGTALAVDSNRTTWRPEIRCPYGQPGDRLWVREAWSHDGPDLETVRSRHEDVMPQETYGPYYRATETAPETLVWRPSIHMPRWASRITLEVTGVRVERLQNISKADAIAEGLEEGIPASGADVRVWKNYSPNKKDTPWLVCPLNSYFSLWQSINGPGSWEANPWVWVVEFKRLEGGAA